MTYTLAYNNYNMTCENCIGTWSGERMKQTYTLMDYKQNPWTGRGTGTYTDYGVNQPYGIFALDRLDNDKNANTKLLGSIAYLRGSDRFAPERVIRMSKLDSIELAHTVVYIEPGTHSTVKRFFLNNLPNEVGMELT